MLIFQLLQNQHPQVQQDPDVGMEKNAEHNTTDPIMHKTLITFAIDHDDKNQLQFSTH
eukprot:m.26884 g.26884  ORF g.26884 m.26884 type:complete len:58 (+) comp5896_c0_seq2:578-751(+)